MREQESDSGSNFLFHNQRIVVGMAVLIDYWISKGKMVGSRSFDGVGCHCITASFAFVRDWGIVTTSVQDPVHHFLRRVVPYLLGHGRHQVNATAIRCGAIRRWHKGEAILQLVGSSRSSPWASSSPACSSHGSNRMWHGCLVFVVGTLWYRKQVPTRSPLGDILGLFVATFYKHKIKLVDFTPSCVLAMFK
jgi:hypothetical protein